MITEVAPRRKRDGGSYNYARRQFHTSRGSCRGKSESLIGSEAIRRQEDWSRRCHRVTACLNWKRKQPPISALPMMRVEVFSEIDGRSVNNLKHPEEYLQ